VGVKVRWERVAIAKETASKLHLGRTPSLADSAGGPPNSSPEHKLKIVPELLVLSSAAYGDERFAADQKLLFGAARDEWRKEQ
jgi:hypothetical protein